MANNKAPQQGDYEKKKRFVDVQTDKRNYEHLTDENDEISEQDISNVRTDVADANENISLSHLKDDEKLPEDETDELKKEEPLKDNSDPSIQTPWNILGS